MQCRRAGVCPKVWAPSVVDVTILLPEDFSSYNTTTLQDPIDGIDNCDSHWHQALIDDGKNLELITEIA